MSLTELIGQLAHIGTRRTIACEVAKALGSEELLLFLPDSEVGELLPASGFPQTIRRGSEWRAFLAKCLAEGTCHGEMPSALRVADLSAWGYRIEPGAVMVLLGGTPDQAVVREALPLFPLLVAIATTERTVRALGAKAQMAETAAAQSAVLAKALQRSRDQLRQALTDAKEANLAKAGFLAMMSHELRTPLNAIGGYAGLLEEGVKGPLAAGQREYLERIKRSQKHLSALINDVLNYAKVESGTITFNMESLELGQVLSSVAPLIDPMASARTVVYEYIVPTEEIVVWADRDKIVQVVLNLLTNAVKYTPPKGQVILRAWSTPESARVTVADSGPGIPHEKQTSIFEPFVQLERSFAQARDGVGLGLSISRELARGMSGDIVVESEPGQGSTFVFSLPLRGPEPDEHPSTEVHAEGVLH